MSEIICLQKQRRRRRRKTQIEGEKKKSVEKRGKLCHLDSSRVCFFLS